ncbi:hypothetical protein SFC65_04525 [Priestia filamentosa]|uniref:hypothetical protein n=1 Tax=Priestia filamentosa TaxID=1402861 RepID=UPI003982A22E
MEILTAVAAVAVPLSSIFLAIKYGMEIWNIGLDIHSKHQKKRLANKHPEKKIEEKTDA